MDFIYERTLQLIEAICLYLGHNVVIGAALEDLREAVEEARRDNQETRQCHK
jgi:hypothetical protein